MEATTYSNRTNARRAGVAAGIPSERVEITVHKNGGEVRFGWKAMESAVSAVATPNEALKAAKVQQDEHNGVKRPKAGGLCAAVWAWLDAHPGVTVKDAKAVAAEHGWNINNVACEFYAWRKFNGISGRQAKAA